MRLHKEQQLQRSDMCTLMELAVGRCCVRGQVSIFGRKENLFISQIKLVAFQVIYDVDIFFEWKLFSMLKNIFRTI